MSQQANIISETVWQFQLDDTSQISFSGPLLCTGTKRYYASTGEEYKPPADLQIANNVPLLLAQNLQGNILFLVQKSTCTSKFF